MTTLNSKNRTGGPVFDIVDSVKGIGPVIATEVLITTNEFKDISDPKKYACYSGFAPFEHSSGKYKGKLKVSNKANKKVKALFHNGAMSAIQHCKEIKEYHQRKVGEDKNEIRTADAARYQQRLQQVNPSYFCLYFSKRKI